MEISRYLVPWDGRFLKQSNSSKLLKASSIYDSTGTRALRILAAGMMSGMTSPARPWFRLGAMDGDLMQSRDVKIWLDEVTKIMLGVFQRSNVYRVLHTMYEDLGSFGTSACLVLPDYDNVIHCYPISVGEFSLSTNWKGRVDTLYREFTKSVAATVSEFGIESVSPRVRNMYDTGNLDAQVAIVHVIEPRRERDISSKLAKNMPWKSVYFEQSNSKNILRESGFDTFPALCPRWSVSGDSVYGKSPGMEALGDIKQLQHEQLRKAQAIDFQTDPPLQVPTSMAGREINRFPGGVTYVDAPGQASSVKTAFDVNLNLSELLRDIQDVRGRIDSTFYADIFLMISSQSDARMTATEVVARHEEKLLMLGPVLERLQNEMLDPLINMTFDAIMAAGIAQPPPEELQGRPVKIELVSMLAQAQRAIGTNSIDRFAQTMGQIATLKPDVLDKFNSDEWADIYSDSLGIDPKLIISDEQANAARESRAHAQAQAQKEAQMQQAAKTASTLASTKTNEPNALTDITHAFTGYT